MNAKQRSFYRWLTGFSIWFVVLASSFAAWVWVEKAIWSVWPPPLKLNELHLIRGVLISFLTSLVAVGVVARMKKSEAIRVNTHRAFSNQLIESAHSLIVGMKPDGEILIFNQRLEELTGYEQRDIIGKNWFDIFLPRDRRSHVEDVIQKIMAGETVRDFQNPVRLKDGREINVAWNGMAIKDEKGRVVGMIGVGRNLTEGQLLQEKLALFSSAFEHSTDAILMTDLTGKIVAINEAFSRLFDYNQKEVVGNTPHIIRSRHTSNQFYRKMWDSINTRDEWKGEIINQTRDGREIPIWLSITPILHEGKKIGYMGIEMDMREKKELEKRALEAERLAAMGRMSSQVAHEVRNPLSSISLNVELLRRELEIIRQQSQTGNFKEAGALLEAIEKEVDRLGQLTEDYLRFFRLPRAKKETIDLNELFATLLAFLGEEARRQGIEVVFQKSESLPSALVDARQLEQALLNLIKNAFEAMPSGGKVEAGIFEEEGSLIIFVRDEGSGMDEETQRRIFDPFFTTKERGTGLGLSLVRQVVAEHEGTVWCESTKGKGTTFFIRLPALVEGRVSV